MKKRHALIGHDRAFTLARWQRVGKSLPPSGYHNGVVTLTLVPEASAAQCLTPTGVRTNVPGPTSLDRSP